MMVASKRCKICTSPDADNIPILGDYFGRFLPDLIEKICGIELDPRKIKGVLICQHCSIQLVHTDVIIDKLRNTLHRLTKLVKETKHKTPSKDSAAAQGRKNINEKKVASFKDSEKSETCEIESIRNSNKQETQDEPKTPKKVRRESVFPGDRCVKTGEEAMQNGDVRNAVTIKMFKKIADDGTTPVKATPQKATKRKQSLNGDRTESNSDNFNETDVSETITLKRNKVSSISVAEEIPMNITIDEINCTASTNKSTAIEAQTKVLNCVICGKGFNQKSSLREHIESNHMGEKLKTCQHCQSEFRSQQKYESHVFTEKCKNSKHVCQYPECNKRFKTVHKMELHMQIKHSSSQQGPQVE